MNGICHAIVPKRENCPGTDGERDGGRASAWREKDGERRKRRDASGNYPEHPSRQSDREPWPGVSSPRFIFAPPGQAPGCGGRGGGGGMRGGPEGAGPAKRARRAPARWPGAFGRMQEWLEAEGERADPAAAAGGEGGGGGGPALVVGHLEVRDQAGAGGHSVFAVGPRNAGEPLVRVPQSCVLHWGRVVESDFGRRLEARRAELAAAPEEAVQVHQQTVLLLFMAAGRRDSACPWQPYFDTMPGEPQHLLAWPAELLADEFAGTHLAHAAEKERAELRAEYEALRGCGAGGESDAFPSWEDLLWAHGNYLSRRFHPGMATGAPEGSEVPCLIPGLDMFNHRTGEQVTLEADAAHAQIVCDAPVAEGAEIFINYGHKSNEELLFAYGFCLRDNPLDLVTIQLGCDGAGEVGVYRRELLRSVGVPWQESVAAAGPTVEKLSIGPFFIRSAEMGGIPGELLSALGVCMVESPGEELQLTLDEIEGLQEKLQSKLAALRPREEGDGGLLDVTGGHDAGGRAVLGSGCSEDVMTSQRRRAAAIYRDGQRRILREAILELEELISPRIEDAEEVGGE